MAEPNPNDFEMERYSSWLSMAVHNRMALVDVAKRPEQDDPHMSPGARQFILENYQRDLDEGLVSPESEAYILT